MIKIIFSNFTHRIRIIIIMCIMLIFIKFKSLLSKTHIVIWIKDICHKNEDLCFLSVLLQKI